MEAVKWAALRSDIVELTKKMEHATRKAERLNAEGISNFKLVMKSATEDIKQAALSGERDAKRKDRKDLADKKKEEFKKKMEEKNDLALYKAVDDYENQTARQRISAIDMPTRRHTEKSDDLEERIQRLRTLLKDERDAVQEEKRRLSFNLV